MNPRINYNLQIKKISKRLCSNNALFKHNSIYNIKLLQTYDYANH